MAIGKASDFKIYQDEVRGAIVERLTQASAYFNAAGGAIRLGTVSHRGNYHNESFFKNISSLVTRRDATSVSAATDLALTMDDIISVKLNRKVGPVAQTLDAFRKAGLAAGEDSLSFLVGTQVAKAMEVDMLNSAIRAARAALANQSAVLYDGTAGTMTTAALVSGLAKFGDNASKISAWVMHSKSYFDLVQYQINPSNNGDVVANAIIQAASPATLGRPVIITDSADLIATGTPDEYFTLGLTSDAVVVESSEEEMMESQIVTGLENLVVRLQGEFAYNLGVKGFKWDTTNGGVNPADAAVATGSNWDPAASSYKDYAGVVVETD